ncbi:hypothetical protein M3Y97_00007100 [Aphelenchoides bicaudatus]|nr:hypothetical protein M3Y97_00007100 [Aphelenchoides bicaudatus]
MPCSILAKLDGDALGKAYSAFEKLARDRKEVYQQYFDALKPSFGEADNIKWIVNMKNNDEDIYKVVKLFYDANVAGFDSSDKNALIKDISDATEKASKFLEYYYGRIQRMKSDSIEDFAVFKKDVYFTFSKLDKKAKEVLANKFPQISKFVDIVSIVQRRAEMKLELLLFSLFVGLCLGSPLKKWDAREEDGPQTASEFLNSLPATQQKAYMDYLTNATTETEIIQAASQMHRRDIKLYHILQLSFEDLVKNYKGTEAAKKFLEFYFKSIDNIKTGSTGEIEKHRKLVREKWDELPESVKTEFGKEYGSTKLYIEGLDGIAKEYQELSPEQKVIYKTYFNEHTEMLPEGRVAKMDAKMHRDDAEIYKILKMIFDHLIKDYDGSEESRAFFQFYFDQIDKMPDDSAASYDAFVLNSKAEWNKLSDDAKEDILIAYPGTAQIMGEQISHTEAFNSLKLEKQMTYVNLLEAAKGEKESVRMAAYTHKNEPELFKVLRIVSYKMVHDFDGGRQAKNFLRFYFDSINTTKDDSDAEIQKYADNVKAKWETLSDDAKEQLLKKYSFVGVNV